MGSARETNRGNGNRVLACSNEEVCNSAGEETIKARMSRMESLVLGFGDVAGDVRDSLISVGVWVGDLFKQGLKLGRFKLSSGMV